MKNHLTEAFNYDLWANLRWLEFLPQSTTEEKQVFDHIFMAQKLWSDRVKGNSPTIFPIIEPTPENLNLLHQTWINLIQTKNPDETIRYKRTNGDPQTLEFSQIARHVANHGTYHRGQIRGLCQARECTDFPETDIIHFFWAN